LYICSRESKRDRRKKENCNKHRSEMKGKCLHSVRGEKEIERKREEEREREREREEERERERERERHLEIEEE
jgi:hypothetical protein